MYNSQKTCSSWLKLLLHVENKSSSAQCSRNTFHDISLVPPKNDEEHWKKNNGILLSTDYFVSIERSRTQRAFSDNSVLCSSEIISSCFSLTEGLSSLGCHEALILLLHLARVHDLLNTNLSKDPQITTADRRWKCCHGVNGLCLVMELLSILRKKKYWTHSLLTYPSVFSFNHQYKILKLI